MHLDKKFFFSHLKKINTIEDRPNIAVGVSGGPDSMALAYLLNLWIRSKKGRLFILVFNHGIRKESTNEAFLVKKMLSTLNAKIALINVKKNSKIKKNMAQARKNRLEGLINYCTKNNILHLFLGHHLDDNLETFLIRKINGSNLQGLESMKHVNYFNKIAIYRPFINLKKKKILNFNKKNNIQFLNDPSNQDFNYTRVKIREFLYQNEYKKNIRNDFLNIRAIVPNYKKMIWEQLIKTVIEINENKIILKHDKFVKNDNLIIEKHISILLKFLSYHTRQTKSSKIIGFINLIRNTSFKKFNLSGITIEKVSNLLVFSLN